MKQMKVKLSIGATGLILSVGAVYITYFSIMVAKGGKTRDQPAFVICVVAIYIF